jgi:hypothetical protein
LNKSDRLPPKKKNESKRRKTLQREPDWVRQGAKGQDEEKARLNN